LTLCLLLVNVVWAGPTLIISVSLGTNPDGSVFSGVPFRVDVSTVPNVKVSVYVKPIGNLSYTYTYEDGMLTIVGDPGYYYVVVNASLGSLSDERVVKVRVVEFKPEFRVVFVNGEEPFTEGLKFMVSFVGSENWVLPVTFQPILESYVDLGRYKATVYPSSAVLTPETRNVTVTVSFVFARSSLPPGMVRVGIRLKCFYWSDDYVVSVPTYYLLERSGTVRFNVPVNITITAKGKTYHDNGETIMFPPVYAQRLHLRIVSVGGDRVLFDKDVDGRAYADFLLWVQSAKQPYLFLKASNSSSPEGCYLYVVGGRQYRIATLSPIGIPNSTSRFAPVPGSKLYCVGAYSVVVVHTVRGGNGIGMTWVVIPVLILGLVAVAVLVRRKKRKVVVEEVGSEESAGGSSESEEGAGGADFLQDVLRDFMESSEEGGGSSEEGGGSEE